MLLHTDYLIAPIMRNIAPASHKIILHSWFPGQFTNGLDWEYRWNELAFTYKKVTRDPGKYKKKTKQNKIFRR